MEVTTKKSPLVEDFENNFKNHLSTESISKAVENLERIDGTSLKAASAYGAHGALASLVFYVKAQCSINNGKTFNGNAWGVSFPGGGALFGDVYLSSANSLDQLYKETSSFTFTATPVYTAFYFFDKNSNLLGHFQAGSVSTATGTGGGSGSWS